MAFDLYIDVRKTSVVGGWWVGVHTLDFNVRSGPLMTFEIEIGDAPGPKLDN